MFRNASMNPITGVKIRFWWITQSPSARNYNINKDVGGCYIYTTKVSFNDQIKYITARAYSISSRETAGRWWTLNNTYALKIIYCCFVRSILKYIPVCTRKKAWKCSKAVSIIRIGWRNRLSLTSYSHRCKLIDLESLRTRRRKFCAI